MDTISRRDSEPCDELAETPELGAERRRSQWATLFERLAMRGRSKHAHHCHATADASPTSLRRKANQGYIKREGTPNHNLDFKGQIKLDKSTLRLSETKSKSRELISKQHSSMQTQTDEAFAAPFLDLSHPRLTTTMHDPATASRLPGTAAAQTIKHKMKLRGQDFSMSKIASTLSGSGSSRAASNEEPGMQKGMKSGMSPSQAKSIGLNPQAVLMLKQALALTLSPRQKSSRSREREQSRFKQDYKADGKESKKPQIPYVNIEGIKHQDA